jgi:hypothetical protein
MKCVAIGDIFITPYMMRNGIEGFDGLTFNQVDYFYFGLNSRHEMRHIVKVIETGGFETLELPEGLLTAVRDADVIMCHLWHIPKSPAMAVRLSTIHRRAFYTMHQTWHILTSKYR